MDEPLRLLQDSETEEEGQKEGFEGGEVSAGYDEAVATERLREFVGRLRETYGRRVGFDVPERELDDLADECGIGPSYVYVGLVLDRRGDFIRFSYLDGSEDITYHVIAVDHLSGGESPTMFTLLSPAAS